MYKHFTYRLVIAIVFSGLFLSETFGGLFTLAGYYIDTPAYEANCINKDKPQMHCNGKCQLQKKLDQENNKDKQNTEHKNDTGTEVLSSRTFFASVQTPAGNSIEKKYFIINAGSAVDHSFSFFHPPQRFFI